MAETKTPTFALMDAPFESARTTTALRLIDIAVRRGYAVNVFAYEGAVLLPFSRQQPHPNAVHGRNVEGENHLLTKRRHCCADLAGGEEWRQARLGQLRALCRRARRWCCDSRCAAWLTGRFLADGRGLRQHARHRHTLRRRS